MRTGVAIQTSNYDWGNVQMDCHPTYLFLLPITYGLKVDVICYICLLEYQLFQ